MFRAILTGRLNNLSRLEVEKRSWDELLVITIDSIGGVAGLSNYGHRRHCQTTVIQTSLKGDQRVLTYLKNLQTCLVQDRRGEVVWEHVLPATHFTTLHVLRQQVLCQVVNPFTPDFQRSLTSHRTLQAGQRHQALLS